MATTNTKVEIVPAAPETPLPLKQSALTVQSKGHLVKHVFIEVPEDITFQNLLDDPKLFRLIQKSRDALNEDDIVTLRSFSWRVHTSVDFASPEEALLFKAPVLTRRDRNRVPYQDDNFEVRSVGSGWSWFRRKDSVRMTTAIFPTWEQAKLDLIRNQSGVRVG
jgi:hypothetical protein